jgi:hypothetical protein
MKYKIIFGIVLPILVIVLLAIFGSLNIGFSVEENYKTEIAPENFYDYTYGVKQYIEIGSVNFENEYFLSKRYTLPALKACLIDKDGNKPGVDAGTITFSEGDIDYVPSKGSIYSYSSSKEHSINIGTGEKKEVKIYLQPNYNFQNKAGTELQDRYGEYDTLVIVSGETNYYRRINCYSLTPSQRTDAEAEIPVSMS